MELGVEHPADSHRATWPIRASRCDQNAADCLFGDPLGTEQFARGEPQFTAGNYFTLRRHLGAPYLELLRFFLNHRRSQSLHVNVRSAGA